MALPASALPVEPPTAFLGVSHSATGKLWRDRLDARGATRALAIAQRYQLPEMLARVLAGRDVAIDAVEDFLDPTIRKMLPDPLHRDADGSRCEADRGRGDARRDRSRSSAITTSTAPPRRRCSPGTCAIAGSIP